MVRRSPARPSQLPDWYSSGVLAGLFLRRVNPLHPKGLRGGVIGLPRPSWWPVSGQTPPCYTFPPEAEASGQRAYAMWWIRMLFHSLEYSVLPSSWGSKLTSQKLAFGTQAPPTLATLGPSFSHPSCAPSTLGRDFESLAAWASHSHNVFDAARFPEGNETLSLEAIPLSSLRALALDRLHTWFRAQSHWRHSHSVFNAASRSLREPWLHA